ncbi:MAG: hypothetical protein WA624_01955 [Methylocella sp.]
MPASFVGPRWWASGQWPSSIDPQYGGAQDPFAAVCVTLQELQAGKVLICGAIAPPNRRSLAVATPYGLPNPTARSNPCHRTKRPNRLPGLETLSAGEVRPSDEGAEFAPARGADESSTEDESASATSMAAGAAMAAIESLQFSAATRKETIFLLDEVDRYLRVAEPSSPIPWVIDRAKALADIAGRRVAFARFRAARPLSKSHRHQPAGSTGRTRALRR